MGTTAIITSERELDLLASGNGAAGEKFKFTDDFAEAMLAEISYQKYLSDPVTLSLEELAAKYGLSD